MTKNHRFRSNRLREKSMDLLLVANDCRFNQAGLSNSTITGDL